MVVAIDFPAKFTPSQGGVSHCYLTIFQKHGQLRLQLQRPNCIAVLLAAGAGFDDLVEQS